MIKKSFLQIISLIFFLVHLHPVWWIIVVDCWYNVWIKNIYGVQNVGRETDWVITLEIKNYVILLNEIILTINK